MTMRRDLVHARSLHGFTLIEISVVLLIVGILTTFLVLSIGNRPLDDRMHNQARRLKQLIAMAENEAQLKGVQIGLQVGSNGYRFLRLKGGFFDTLSTTQQTSGAANNGSGSIQQQSATPLRWVVYDQSGPFRPRKLPSPFSLSLHLGSHDIKANRLMHGGASDNNTDSTSQSGDKHSVIPQILLLSSGETTAFSLTITAPGQPLSYTLSSDALGRLKLKQAVEGR